MPVRRTRRKIGGSFKNFINKAGDFFRRTKLLSTIGRQLAPLAGPYAGLASQAVDAAAKAGYGRRRMRRGGALRPVGARRMGGMIAPVGGMRSRRVGSMSSKVMRHAMPQRMAMKF